MRIWRGQSSELQTLGRNAPNHCHGLIGCFSHARARPGCDAEAARPWPALPQNGSHYSQVTSCVPILALEGPSCCPDDCSYPGRLGRMLACIAREGRRADRASCLAVLPDPDLRLQGLYSLKPRLHLQAKVRPQPPFCSSYTEGITSSRIDRRELEAGVRQGVCGTASSSPEGGPLVSSLGARAAARSLGLAWLTSWRGPDGYRATLPWLAWDLVEAGELAVEQSSSALRALRSLRPAQPPPCPPAPPAPQLVRLPPGILFARPGQTADGPTFLQCLTSLCGSRAPASSERAPGSAASAPTRPVSSASTAWTSAVSASARRRPSLASRRCVLRPALAAFARPLAGSARLTIRSFF